MCSTAVIPSRYGGALFNENGSALALTQCTLAGNGSTPSTVEAGAPCNRGAATPAHCTVAGNTAVNVGGICNAAGRTLTLTNLIAGANTGAQAPDIRNEGTLAPLAEKPHRQRRRQRPQRPEHHHRRPAPRPARQLRRPHADDGTAARRDGCSRSRREEPEDMRKGLRKAGDSEAADKDAQRTERPALVLTREVARNTDP